MFFIMLVPVVFGLLLYSATLFLIAFSSRTAQSVCMPGVRPVPWWCSWLLLVPLFSLGWAFVLVRLLSRRMRPVLEERQIPLSAAGRSFGLMFAWSQLAIFVIAGAVILYLVVMGSRYGDSAYDPMDMTMLVFFAGGSGVLVFSVLMLVFGIAYAMRLRHSKSALDVPPLTLDDVPPTDRSMFTQARD